MDLAMTVRPAGGLSPGRRSALPAACHEDAQPAPWPGPHRGRSRPHCRTRSPAATRPPGSRLSSAPSFLSPPQVTAAAAPVIPVATGATAAAAPTTAITTEGGDSGAAAEAAVPPGDPRWPCGTACLKLAQVSPAAPSLSSTLRHLRPWAASALPVKLWLQGAAALSARPLPAAGFSFSPSLEVPLCSLCGHGVPLGSLSNLPVQPSVRGVLQVGHQSLLQPQCSCRLPIKLHLWGTSRLPIPSILVLGCLHSSR